MIISDKGPPVFKEVILLHVCVVHVYVCWEKKEDKREEEESKYRGRNMGQSLLGWQLLLLLSM